MKLHPFTPSPFRPFVLLAICLIVAACAVPADRPLTPLSTDTASLYAPHGEPGAWFNPWHPQQKKSSTIFAGGPHGARTLENDAFRLTCPGWKTLAPRSPHRENSASVTWVGHSTFVVHDDEDVFLTDPQFNTRAFLPKRYHPPGVPISSIPGSAFAVVSHNHYDHLDAYTVKTLPASVTWFVPMGLGEWIRKRGPTM